MTKYRFKTAREFQRDDEYDYKHNVPKDWNTDGDMDEYMGQDIPDTYIDEIERGNDIKMDGWHFNNENIIENDRHTYKPTTQNAAPYILIRRKTTS